MLQDPPAWSMSATAPTDWTLLQQAKALRLGESPPPMNFLPDSHRNYHLAMTALGMQPPKRRRGWRLLLLVVLLGAVAAACYGMRVQPNTVVSSPTSIVTTKLVPTTKRKKKHHSTVNKAVKCVDTGYEVNKKHHRRRVEVQIHNTSRVNHAIDTSKSTNKVMTRKPWMELFTGATPPEVKTKRKQVPKWLERFIVECDKIKWKGHRFLI
jgi:ferric-dicitrate binding protein FerR (iron transport regulator)